MLPLAIRARILSFHSPSISPPPLPDCLFHATHVLSNVSQGGSRPSADRIAVPEISSFSIAITSPSWAGMGPLQCEADPERHEKENGLEEKHIYP